MPALCAQVDRLEARVAKLVDLVYAVSLTSPTTIIQLQQNTTVQVNIVGFDQADRIHVPPAHIHAAFSKNPRLVEYCRWPDAERVDAAKAAPFVLEALVDLVRRAHRDPAYRNVYLDPRRADQAMVYVADGAVRPRPAAGAAAAGVAAGPQCWEARPLAEAICLLLRGRRRPPPNRGHERGAGAAPAERAGGGGVGVEPVRWRAGPLRNQRAGADGSASGEHPARATGLAQECIHFS